MQVRRTFSVLRWRYVALAYNIQQPEHGGQVGLVHEVRVLPLGSFSSLHPFQRLDQELAWSFCNAVELPTDAGQSASDRRSRNPFCPPPHPHPAFHGAGAYSCPGRDGAPGPGLPCPGARCRTGAVIEQQRAEAVEQLGEPVALQIVAALLLARRHPALLGDHEPRPAAARAGR